MKKLSALLFIFLLSVCISGCGKVGTDLKSHIEQVGSELTGTPVTVEKVNIKPARGAGEINGFRVSNLDGYIARNAMSFETLRVNVGLVSTVAGDPLVLDKLVISYPVLNLEQNEQGGSNLREIFENTKNNMEKADRKSADIEPGSKDEPGKPLRIKVKELVIEGVTLNVHKADGSTHSAILPAITLEDIGGKKGATPARLGLVVVGAMTGEVLKQALARELIERAGDIKQALSTDNLMAVIDYKLHLTPGLEERVRPVVDDLSKALIATIDGWIDKGHIDLAELNKQFVPLFEEFKNRLEEFLASDQFQQLEERVFEIKDNAVEVLRYLAINKIAEKLDMTPEQVMELRPILHEHGVRISNMIKEIAADPHIDKEVLTTVYQEVAEQLRLKLSDKLSEEQMAKYVIWQEELLSTILQVAEKYL